jgi:hypothetical protein
MGNERLLVPQESDVYSTVAKHVELVERKVSHGRDHQKSIPVWLEERVRVALQPSCGKVFEVRMTTADRAWLLRRRTEVRTLKVGPIERTSRRCECSLR